MQYKAKAREDKHGIDYIGTRVKEVIAKSLEIKKDFNAITDDKNLRDIGINSITFMKIIVTLENEFNIEFSDEDLDYNKFSACSALISYILNKTKQT